MRPGENAGLSALTFTTNTSTSGDKIYEAFETNDPPGFGDDITIASGVTVSTTGFLYFQAGDDIVLSGKASTSTNALKLYAGVNDADGHGSIIQTSLSNSLESVTLTLSALTGIGEFSQFILFYAGAVEAQSATGSIFLSTHIGFVTPGQTLQIGGADAVINGIQATVSGDIALEGFGTTIDLNGTSADRIHTANGNVTGPRPASGATCSCATTARAPSAPTTAT